MFLSANCLEETLRPKLTSFLPKKLHLRQPTNSQNIFCKYCFMKNTKRVGEHLIHPMAAIAKMLKWHSRNSRIEIGKRKKYCSEEPFYVCALQLLLPPFLVTRTSPTKVKQIFFFGLKDLACVICLSESSSLSRNPVLWMGTMCNTN